MRILPVLDIQGGLVVRGIGGLRHQYRPIRSKLAATSQIIDVALGFRTHFGLNELYVADLDAIAQGNSTVDTYITLHEFGFALWVDAGLHRAKAAAPLISAGVGRVIFGLETLAGPEELAKACSLFGEHVVFSLDLKQGTPLGDPTQWNAADALSIAEQAIAAGVGSMILLDLARVGKSEGTGTDSLCAQLVAAYPHLELVTGGGVRNIDDLRALDRRGVSGVLVASALHDGTLRREDLAEFGCN